MRLSVKCAHSKLLESMASLPGSISLSGILLVSLSVMV